MKLKHLTTLLLIFSLSFSFAQEKEDKTIETLTVIDENSGEIPFAIVEKIPIYPGCDKNMSNRQLKKCMSKKIVDVVLENFDTEVATNLILDSDIVKIYVTFKVDKEGNVIDIRTRSPHPKLGNEAKRVVELLPQMSSPGMHKGKAVVVPYSLPIMFKLEAPETDKN